MSAPEMGAEWLARPRQDRFRPSEGLEIRDLKHGRSARTSIGAHSRPSLGRLALYG